jgi:hypothetical protein
VTPATATVDIDGTAATVTAGSFSVSVTAGIHSIVASASGYVTYYTNVSVSAGATTTVTITLKAVTPSGYLAGTVSPASATLSVDGQAESVVSGTFNVTLSAGLHVVEVTASGYLPYVTLVDIAGGATTKETIALSALPTTSPSSTYLSPLAYGLIAVLAVLAIIFLIIAATRGRRNPPAAQSWSPGGAPPPPTQPPGSQP